MEPMSAVVSSMYPALSTEWQALRQVVLRTAGFEFSLLSDAEFGRSLRSLSNTGVLAHPAFDDDLRAARERLRAVVQEERFLEALLLINPGVLAQTEALLASPLTAQPNSAERRLERTLAIYLQRFCSKNDSNSHFGPYAFGLIGPHASPLLSYRAGPLVSQRSIHISHWAAKELAKALAPSGNRIPSQTWHPAAFIEATGKERESLDSLLQKVSIFSNVSFQQRRCLLPKICATFEAITGHDSTRNPGLTYGDRSLFSEECRSGESAVTLSASFMRSFLARHGVIFDAVRFPGLCRLVAERQAFAAYFQTRWSRATVQYAEVQDHLQGHVDLARKLKQDAYQRWLRMMSPFLDRLSTIPKEGWASRRTCAIDQRTWSTLASAGDSIREEVPDHFSIDLLFQSADANGKECQNVVLGELHNTISVNGFFASMHPDPEVLKRDVTLALKQCGGHRSPVGFLMDVHNKTYVDLPLPIPAIEYSGSALPGAERLALEDLQLRAESGRVELFQRGSEQPLYLTSKFPAILNVYPLYLFGVPNCSLRMFLHLLARGFSHVPRLFTDDLVISRERWLAPRAEVLQVLAGTPADAFAGVQSMRTTNGWPRFLFSRGSEAEKPQLVDLSNWLLLDAWAHRVRRSSSTMITLTEMLPDDSHLWLKRAKGTYTSELRIACFRA